MTAKISQMSECKYRGCVGCPNSIIGASYQGPTGGGSPFPVVAWQDCCAACQLYADCAAWVHYTLPAGLPQMCYFRTSVTRLNPSDPAGNRTMTGLKSARSIPSPSPPPAMTPMTVSPPPSPPIPGYVVGIPTRVQAQQLWVN